jgi:hypothetical protein
VSNPEQFTYEEHIEAVHRTNNTPLSALALGLAGEYFEWASTNFTSASEKGDLLWYVTALAQWFGFLREEDSFRQTMSLFLSGRLVTRGGCNPDDIGAVCELVKKHIAHNKPISEGDRKDKMRAHLVLLTMALWKPEVAYHNNTKLKKRHPEGFVRDTSLCGSCGKAWTSGSNPGYDPKTEQGVK